MLNLGSAVAYLKLNTSDFDSSIGKAQSKFAGAGKAIGIAAGALVTSAAGGMIAFGKAAVDAGMTFDKSMSQVAATMGVTVDEIQDLKDYAMEMGAKTAFSASEAADALNYMALAGYDAETSMSMLPNVLNLAAAGGIELARASDMITDTQSALGLSLDETAELVDKMARASSKSNTSVEQLGDAMLTVGGTAKNLKGGTTELATMLGVLADNGIKGAEGGTALRNVILALSAPTEQAAKKLEELGVQAYDAEGNLRPMTDIFDDLNAALDNMNQSERTEVLNTIFNKVDLKSANALLATSSERYNELSESIDSASGAAQKMAETQLDNLAGDITLFKSAMEGARITISNSLTPALRNFVQFGTREIEKLSSAFQSGGISGFADQLGKSLSAGINKIFEYAPAFVNAAVDLASSFVSSIASSLPKLANKVFGLIPNLMKKLGQFVVKELPNLVASVGKTIGELIGNAPKIIAAGVELVGALVKGVVMAIPNLVSAIVDGIADGWNSTELSEAQQGFIDHLDEVKQKLEEIPTAVDRFGSSMADINAKQNEAEHWIEIFDDLSKKTNPTAGDMELLKTAVGKLNDLFPDLDLHVKENTGEWSLNTEEIRNSIAAIQDRAKAEAYFNIASDIETEVMQLELENQKRRSELKLINDRKKALEDSISVQKDTIAKANEYWDAIEKGRMTFDFDAIQRNTELLNNMFPDKTIVNANDFYRVMIELYRDLSTNQQAFADLETQSSTMADEFALTTVKIGEMRHELDWLYDSGGKLVSGEIPDEFEAIGSAIEIADEKTLEGIHSMVDAFTGFVKDSNNAGKEAGGSFTNSLANSIKAGMDDVNSAGRILVTKFLNKIRGWFGAASFGGSGSQGSYASGLDYVPRTMQVTVHRGERILTEEQNKKYSSTDRIEVKTYQDTKSFDKLNSTMNSVLNELKQLKEFKVELDGKKVVGALVKEIDHQLAYQN